MGLTAPHGAESVMRQDITGQSRSQLYIALGKTGRVRGDATPFGCTESDSAEEKYPEAVKTE